MNKGVYIYISLFRDEAHFFHLLMDRRIWDSENHERCIHNVSVQHPKEKFFIVKIKCLNTFKQEIKH